MDVKKTCLGEEMATAAMAEEAQTEAILGYRPRFSSKNWCCVCLVYGNKIHENVLM